MCTCPKRLFSQEHLSIYTALKWLHAELWAAIKYIISLLTWLYALHITISSFRQHMTLTLLNPWSITRCFGWVDREVMATCIRKGWDTCCISFCDLKTHKDPNTHLHRFPANNGEWVINEQRKKMYTFGNKQRLVDVRIEVVIVKARLKPNQII